MVLNKGKVVERGTHEQLLAMKGRYNSMWRKQIKVQQLSDKAERLRNEVRGEDSASQSEDERNNQRGRVSGALMTDSQDGESAELPPGHP